MQPRVGTFSVCNFRGRVCWTFQGTSMTTSGIFMRWLVGALSCEHPRQQLADPSLPGAGFSLKDLTLSTLQIDT